MQSPSWCYQYIKINMDFNALGIIASSNILNQETQENAGDKLTQTPQKGHTVRNNTQLNACEICASSDVPTIQNTQYITIPIYF